MKAEKFTGVNFKRWQTRVQLWPSTMNVFWVVISGPAGPRTAAQQTEYDTATTIFVRCILSVLSDQLCDVYMHKKNAANLWYALEHKFAASNARHELYVIGQYYDYKIVDNRSVVEQAHGLQFVVRELTHLGCRLPDKFVAWGIIAKLPPT